MDENEENSQFVALEKYTDNIRKIVKCANELQPGLHILLISPAPVIEHDLKRNGLSPRTATRHGCMSTLAKSL